MRILAGLFFVMFLTLWDDKVEKTEAAQGQGSPAPSGSPSSKGLPIKTTDPGLVIPVKVSEATAANCKIKPIGTLAEGVIFWHVRFYASITSTNEIAPSLPT